MEKREQADKALPLGIRIEEDGSIVFGNGCLIIKPDGKDVRVKIDDSLCGELTAEAYRDLIERTVGKGGKTLYEVPAKIEKPPAEESQAEATEPKVAPEPAEAVTES